MGDADNRSGGDGRQYSGNVDTCRPNNTFEASSPTRAKIASYVIEAVRYM